MQAKIAKAHNEIPPNPIIAKQGAKGVVVSRSTLPEWKGWLRCRLEDGQEGWISETYLEIRRDDITFVADYTGVEIQVEKNDVVEVLNKNNGWSWIRKSDGREGWIPNSCLATNKRIWLKLGLPAVVGLTALYGMISIGVMDSLDSRLYYSAEAAQSYFLSLSEEKAAHYMVTEQLDLYFLYSYSIFLFFAMSLVYPQKTRWKWYALIPGFFDLLETKGILLALQIGPRPAITSWLGIVTLMKFTTGAVVVGALVLELARRTMRRSKSLQ